MPDNWGFVIAAYALAALVLGGYWRWLARREHDLLTLTASRSDREAVRDDPTSRSRQPSLTGHPRSDPGERGPLQ
jgi:CO/xanthine dehydrogenase Mo-binding subunit